MKISLLYLSALLAITRLDYGQASIAVNEVTGVSTSCLPEEGSGASLDGTSTNSSCYQERELQQQDETETVVSEASYSASFPATAAVDALGADMGEPQVLGGDEAMGIVQRIADARKYMEKVWTDDKYKKVRDICRNQHSQCAFWASIGECEANPGYMTVNCAPVCETCEQLHVETRCPLDPDAVDAFYPGDLDKMFRKIISDPIHQQFEPKVLSRPDYALGDIPGEVDYNIGPWMVLFENAISDAEADRMIELGGLVGYSRSADVGEEKADGTFAASVNEGRTSTNAWCTDVCFEDPIAQRLMQRIENITGIPETNSENLQLLRYTNSQFYQTHNDYIPYQLQRPCGVRILTFYFYLSDVEEGGGTNFPKLGLTVTPKKGHAVLWPSVTNDDPNRKDARTDHQAQPVIKGTKYGANAWIHQRDFKTPNKIGCQ